MGYRFLEGYQYRSPTHFGPSLGPRQGPDGRLFSEDQRTTMRITTRFRSDPDILRRYTPTELEVDDDAVVTLACTYFTNIDWLAGRGYNMVGMWWRAHHKGLEKSTPGDFLSVLWENKADPIITGREELGYPKIFADIHPPEPHEDGHRISASWEGFEFFSLLYKQRSRLDPQDGAAQLKGFGEGSLQLKYLPGVGRTSQGGAAGVTLAPYAVPEGFSAAKPVAAYEADIEFAFHEARWQDMPTQYCIVNALAEIPVMETLNSVVLTTIGGSDLGNTHLLC